MAWLAVLLAAMLVIASLPAAQGRGRIVGGTVVTEIKYPWLATLMSSFKFGSFHTCAGALIAPRWVLTAAHCVDGKFPNRVSLNLLDLAVSTPGERKNRKVTKRIVHPQYVEEFDRNDIALLKLQSPITDIEPLELYRGRDLNPDDQFGISGWGATLQNADADSTELREATVRFVSDANCTQGSDFFAGYPSDFILPGMMCAAEDGIDTCQGDSGGPMFFREGGEHEEAQAVGVVSWGNGCALPDFPGVYTDVKDYVGWIESVAGKVGRAGLQARDVANELCKAIEPNKKACKANNACKLINGGKCRTKIKK